MAQTIQTLPSAPSESSKRRGLFDQSEEELLTHGLDPEGFIRYGLGRNLARVIAVWITVISRPENSNFRGILTDDGANLVRWAEVTGHAAESTASDIEHHGFHLDELSRISAIVHRWVLNASYEDLVEWSPPAAEELLRMPGPGEVTAALCEPYVWLSDRVSEHRIGQLGARIAGE